MKLYHSTTAEAADAIMAEGFRDSLGTNERRRPRGVWFTAKPGRYDRGGLLDTVIEIEVTEWIPGRFLALGRRYCITSEVANSLPRRRLSVDECRQAFGRNASGRSARKPPGRWRHGKRAA